MRFSVRKNLKIIATFSRASSTRLQRLSPFFRGFRTRQEVKHRPLKPLESVGKAFERRKSEISSRIGQIKVKRKDKILLRRQRCVTLRGAGLVLILLMGSDAPDIALRRTMRCFPRLKYIFISVSVRPPDACCGVAGALEAWRGAGGRGEAWTRRGGAEKRFKFGIL